MQKTSNLSRPFLSLFFQYPAARPLNNIVCVCITFNFVDIHIMSNYQYKSPCLKFGGHEGKKRENWPIHLLQTPQSTTICLIRAGGGVSITAGIWVKLLSRSIRDLVPSYVSPFLIITKIIISKQIQNVYIYLFMAIYGLDPSIGGLY